MAKDGEGNRIRRKKIVFYTKGTYSMADAFVKDNPGYTHYMNISEGDSTFMEDWNQPQDFETRYAEAQSTALAKYSRNPIVFGAAKTIDPNDESLWVKAEYPFMQDAGTITKMKDNAKKPEDVDFQIDPPAKAVC